MSLKQFRVVGHLIVPFACPKWEIDRIKIAGVSTDATYFESETHCVHIDRNKTAPLTLSDIGSTWTLDLGSYETEDWSEALDNIRQITKDFGNLQTKHEQLFCDLYFTMLRETWESEFFRKHVIYRNLPDESDDWIFAALLPLPQAHLYVRDPLARGFDYIPKNMFKVDFAFWTGRTIVAVEIDGSSHVGSAAHVRKDRMLQRAGVHVVHILNEELDKHGSRAAQVLLPNGFYKWWQWVPKTKEMAPSNPFAPLPF